MKGKVRRRDLARRNLISIYQRYAREAGLRVADRFLDAAGSTFRRLAKRPGTGMRHEFDHPALTELRVAPLSARFKVYLVFYRPVADGIEIIRVLRGPRDLHGLPAEGFGTHEPAGDELVEEETS